MGNQFSNRFKCNPCHEVLLSRKLIFKDKKIYDEKEHSFHILVREVFEGNFSSPVQDVLLNSDAKILDVGCGPGFWLMEMAADYPKPKYFGIDTLPTFPKSTFPSNIEFLQCNLLNGLPYEDNTFDFIHMQFLACCFTELQWENIIYKELARVLKPGGWLEICNSEIEFINGGPTISKVNSAVCNYLISKRINPLITQRYHSFIKSIPSFSLPTVRHEKRRLLLGPYGNKIGEFGNSHFESFFRFILQGPVGKYMNIKRKDVNSIIDKISIEFELYKPYMYFNRFYVQKA